VAIPLRDLICCKINGDMKKMKTTIPFTGSSLMATFVGRTFRDMIKELAAANDFTLGNEELEELVLREKNAVIARLSIVMEPTVNSDKALAYTAGMGYTMAVVTSSAHDRVTACINRAKQAEYFTEDRLFSAASSLPVPVGKPEPDVYLFGMDKLGKRPDECIAVEDSKSGVLSAIRSGIKIVVGYVGCYEEHEREEKAALLRANGASIIMEDWSEFPSIVENLGGITTILFDYDNTLGLTEVVAFAACSEVVNSVLESKGVFAKTEVEQLA
jgi:beta-phosphoglucomutase-like phosphatase (HAD superfamily)